MNTPNAIRNSHAPVTNTCIDCGDTYACARNAARQSKRCPKCRHIHDIERARERKRYNVSNYAPIRERRERCKRSGRPAIRYPHYCSSHCYLTDFRVAYCLQEVLNHE